MSYSGLQWLLFFYIYCFIGWCFESAYVSIKERRPVNRGFLRLPMLPIYGSGAVAILIVTVPVRGNYVLVWIFGMLSATLLELVTGAVMERLFKVKYWDYSGQKFNFKGYICLSSSIAWGFLSLLLTEVIHEPIEKLIFIMPQWLKIAIAAVITVLFVSDFVVSFKAAWDLRRLLERLTAIKEQAEEMRRQFEERGNEIGERLSAVKAEASAKLATVKEEANVKLTVAKEEASAKWTAAKEEAGEKWASAREEAEAKISALREDTVGKLHGEYLKLSGSRRFFIRRLLRDNPGAVSHKFSEALEELKKRTAHIKGNEHK